MEKTQHPEEEGNTSVTTVAEPVVNSRDNTVPSQLRVDATLDIDAPVGQGMDFRVALLSRVSYERNTKEKKNGLDEKDMDARSTSYAVSNNK